ncbi:response regulator [Chloroflexota bacterium]
MDKVRVFLADWQILFREGIHFTLSGEEDFEVIGEESNNEEALKLIEKNPPDIAILNVNRGKPTGIEITKRIKQNLPSVSVIMVMDNYDNEQLFLAIKSGASACLSKDMDPDELLKTVRKVVHGESPISQALLGPEIASRVIDEFETFSAINEEVSNLLARLLPVETEILRHIANGSLFEEISRALNINEETIRRHLDIILKKLVTNDHNREIVDAAQSTLTSVINKISKPKAAAGKPTVDYITKEEFSSFKEALMERLKSLFSDLT